MHSSLCTPAAACGASCTALALQPLRLVDLGAAPQSLPCLDCTRQAAPLGTAAAASTSSTAPQESHLCPAVTVPPGTAATTSGSCKHILCSPQECHLCAVHDLQECHLTLHTPSSCPSHSSTTPGPPVALALAATGGHRAAAGHQHASDSDCDIISQQTPPTRRQLLGGGQWRHHTRPLLQPRCQRLVELLGLWQIFEDVGPHIHNH